MKIGQKNEILNVGIIGRGELASRLARGLSRLKNVTVSGIYDKKDEAPRDLEVLIDASEVNAQLIFHMIEELERLFKIEDSLKLSKKYAQLLEESNQRLDEKILELELFNEIAKMFSSSAFDRWNITGFLFKVIRKKIQEDVLAVFLMEGDRPRLIFSAGEEIHPEIKKKVRARMISFLPQDPGKKYDPENIAEMEILERRNGLSRAQDQKNHFDLETFYAVPLILLDKTIGYLGVIFFEEHKLTEDDKAFLEIVAAQVALFVENDRIKQAIASERNKLELANKELEAFSYSVSHDLRAPLRHISGFAELLSNAASANLSKEGVHYLDTILQSVNHMGMLIDDLLSFSRMNRVEINYKHVNLRELVEDVIKELEPDIAGRHIDWRVDTLPEVYADQSMLRLVLVNLISNAVKYSRRKEKAVIEVGHDRGFKDETVIFVRDNGVGFDMQYVDKLFGVFQRLHRAEEFEGTGIGLANVRRIIYRHGGRTWAEGKPDQGAVFYFSLPMLKKGDKP